MLITEFDEIRVYAGVAERTGVKFKQSEVRRSGSCCRSLSALIRKARDVGEGTFYLPLKFWPADTERVEIRKEWVGMSSLPPPRRPE
jgi:hypothetical protein